VQVLGLRSISVKSCTTGFYSWSVGFSDLSEFELGPIADGEVISCDKWLSIQHLLLELLPAKRVSLVGHPPSAIRVVGFGGTTVAPALLKGLGDLAGTPLRVVVVTELTWPGFESDRPRAERAVARCLSDLRAVAEGVDLEALDIRLEPCRDPDLGLGFMASLVLFGPWSGATFVGAGLDEEQAAHWLVEQFSMDFTEALASRSIPRARHWPACRFHEHSLSLVLDDDGAAWVCPAGPTWRAKVGEVASLLKH
jgi:hypothetical protein